MLAVLWFSQLRTGFFSHPVGGFGLLGRDWVVSNEICPYLWCSSIICSLTFHSCCFQDLGPPFLLDLYRPLWVSFALIDYTSTCTNDSFFPSNLDIVVFELLSRDWVAESGHSQYRMVFPLCFSFMVPVNRPTIVVPSWASSVMAIFWGFSIRCSW